MPTGSEISTPPGSTTPSRLPLKYTRRATPPYSIEARGYMVANPSVSPVASIPMFA